MSGQTTVSDNFWPLLDAVLDGSLPEAQIQELATLLESDSTVRRLFAHHVQLGSNIHFLCRAKRACDLGIARIDAARQAASPRDPAPAVSFLFTTLSYFSEGMPLAYLLATVIFGVGLLIGSRIYVSGPEQVATQLSPITTDRATHDPQVPFVGRITGMLDCQWADPQAEAFNGANVPLGRVFALNSGLMEITYDTGATVILEGPVTYKMASKNGGFLSLGKLAAKVEQKTAMGFSVCTPTTTVTDLGTEFGAEVSKEGHTTSHVFRGSVKLQMVGADENAEGVTQVLHENESARVEKRSGDQGNGNRLIVLEPSDKQANFVRAIPKQTIKTLDLVDVVAGGGGFSEQRDRGIDPTTGQISNRCPGAFFPTFAGDHRYHRVEGMPFVDGVFIPDGGAGPVQVNSAGHTFNGFDHTDNLTYGHIWAGGPIALANTPRAIRTDLRGGDDYASSGHGLLLVHANSGITFDLEAVRLATGGRILRFSTVGGNAATFSDVESVLADLWVLVDGRPRFIRRKDAGRGGPVLVTVPLAENDRFLTLAFTDGGDGCGWDWTIFGDPRLKLIVTETQQTPNSQAKQ